MRVAILLAMCAACRVPNEKFPVTDAPTGDASTDAPTRCDLTKPFDPPVMITELDDPLLSELNPRLSHDELVIYYWTRPANTTTGADLVTASRSSIGGMFGQPKNLAIDGSSIRRDPSVTGDNYTLYFASDEATTGTNKIFAATRSTTTVDFGNPAQVTSVDTGTGDDQIEPYVIPNDQNMYMAIKKSGSAQYQLYATRRPSPGSAYITPYQNALVNVNDTTVDCSSPVVTADLLTIYFESTRSGGQGGGDIWKATRGDPGNAFGMPVNVSELSTSDFESPGWISDDGCRLYFSRSPLGIHDWKLYVATKPSM